MVEVWRQLCCLFHVYFLSLASVILPVCSLDLLSLFGAENLLEAHDHFISCLFILCVLPYMHGLSEAMFLNGYDSFHFFFRISKFVSARHGSMYAGKIFLTRNGGIEKLDYTKQISLVCVCVCYWTWDWVCFEN